MNEIILHCYVDKQLYSNVRKLEVTVENQRINYFLELPIVTKHLKKS